MSLRQLGEAIGVSRPTVYAYAAGTLQASPERLEAIARVTGVGLEFFEVSDLPLIDGDSVTLVEALLSPPNPDQAVEVATAALTSGLEKEPSRLARLSFQAGNALLQKGRYVAASQHLRDAAADFERSGNRRGVAASLQSLGFCLTNLGELSEAAKCFQNALRVGDPDQRWRASIALAALAEREGRFDEAHGLLGAALRDHSGDPEAVAFIKANEANLLLMRTEYSDAETAIEEALEMCHRLRLMDQSLELNAALALTLSALGRPSEASVALMRASDIAEALEDEARLLWCRVVRASLAKDMGRLEEANLLAAQALADATQRGLPRSKALSLLVLAEASFRRGDWVGAYTHAMQGAAFCDVNRYPTWQTIFLNLAAATCAGSGRIQDGQRVLSEARAVLDSSPTAMGEAWARLGAGLLAWARNDPEKAAAEWQEGARAARSCGASTTEAILARHLECAGDQEATKLLRGRRAILARQAVVWSHGCRTVVERLDDETWYKGLGAPDRLQRPVER